MKKLLLIALVLAIAIGLLFMMADATKAPDRGSKKKATPRPSVSINPYSIPLPQMGPGAGEISTALIRR